MKHIAEVINNNQPGLENIVETEPHVTLDIGTKLYAESDVKKLVDENKRLRDIAKLNNQIIHDSVVEKQAAWIEWKNGGGAEEAMKRIHNSLWGPGFLPDENDVNYGNPQEFYDKNCWAETTGKSV